jgi:hypothetical protein
MIRLALTCVLLTTLVPPLLAQEGIYEDAGSSGMVFLKIGVGPRGSALAGAYSAVADNSMAVFWNPAGLVNLEGNDIYFAHSEYVENIRYEVVSAGMETGIGCFGMGAGALYCDDLELRENPGDPEGKFRFSDYLLSMSYARRMSPESDLGVTLKLLQERIYTYTATGYAFDIGALFRPRALKNLVLTGAVQNLGPKLKYVNEVFRLPLVIRAGASYRVPLDLLDGNWLVSFETAKPVDTDYNYSGGIEYSHRTGLALRAGYRYGHDSESFSAGAGFAVGYLRLDYSYTPWDYEGQGSKHWISVGLDL